MIGISSLRSLEGRLIARCGLLRLSQWALESKDAPPNGKELSRYLQAIVGKMVVGSLTCPHKPIQL